LKHHLRRLQKNTYTYNEFSGGRATGPLGRRAYTSIFNPLVSQIVGVAGSANTASGGLGGVKSYTTDAFLKTMRMHVVITNVENVAAEITLYLLRPIKVHSVSPVSAIGTGIQNEGGSSTTYLDYDQNPKASEEFNKAWKIIRRKHVFIMPGETVKYDCTVGVNKPVNAYDNILNVNLYDSNYTYNILLAQQGGAISNDTTTKSSVSSSSSTLNWVVRYEYVYGTMDPLNVKTLTQPVGNLASAFPVGESIMNEDTAIVATTTSA
jgi:hypothetical protein